MKSMYRLVFFCMLSLFVVTTVQADTLKQDYINLRYRYFILSDNSQFYIDMAEISMVILDQSSITAWKYFGGTGYLPTNDINPYEHKWWLFMKNGQTHYLGGNTAVKDAFADYKQFLFLHPEFVTIR